MNEGPFGALYAPSPDRLREERSCNGRNWSEVWPLKTKFTARGGETAGYAEPIYFCGGSGSGMDIPPMMRQFSPSLSQVCVTRRVCVDPLPSLSSNL